MEINKAIFKAYDIRGIVHRDLNPDIAFRIGRALVDFLGCKKVVVCMDMRESSPDFKKELVRGITVQGADVIDIGMCTTPMHYYANGVLGADASVMVTASHNPSEWNGFKLCREKAIPLSGETGIMDIRDMVIKNEFKEADEPGKVTKDRIVDRYTEFIRGHYRNPENRQLKIVADFGNGMGSYALGAFDLPGISMVTMYEEPDGTFPNHEANPLKHETLDDLRKRVVAEKADLGVAFDGDADRCGMVDERGNIVRNDFLTALIAQDLLSAKKGATILYDLRSSKIVREIIEKDGGRALMCRVGHAFIKNQMRDEGASFAGELSGHYYFEENFNAESSALAALRIVNLIIKSGRKMSELADGLKKYFQSGELNRKVDSTSAVMEKVERHFKDAKEVLHLDGVSIMYDDWWANIRASNTEPLLRLNVEADTEELMEEKRDEILGLYVQIR